jgi:hypothetical protein
MSKKNGSILFKFGAGYNGLKSRIESYDTPFVHGTDVLATIITDKQSRPGLRQVEKYYEEKLGELFEQSNKKNGDSGSAWEDRHCAGEWFIGKYDKLLKLLEDIENDPGKPFKIVKSDTDTKDQDMTRWTYKLFDDF